MLFDDYAVLQMAYIFRIIWVQADTWMILTQID